MATSKSLPKSKSKGDALYEGTHTTFYKGPEPGTLIQQFKDEWTFKDTETPTLIHGKGAINSSLSETLLLCLETVGLETNFVRRLNMREHLVQDLQSLPLIFTMRNVAYDEFATSLGLPEGIHLPEPHMEFRYTSPKKPMVNESQILSFDWANKQELEQIQSIATRINDFLSGYFYAKGFSLVDFNFRLARFSHEEFIDSQALLILNSDLCLDAVRLMDNKSGEIYGRDDNETDAGKLSQRFQDLAQRLDILPGNANSNDKDTK